MRENECVYYSFLAATLSKNKSKIHFKNLKKNILFPFLKIYEIFLFFTL